MKTIRKTRVRQSIWILTVSVAVFIALTSPIRATTSHGQRWVITDLGPIERTGLNERGQVAGTIEVKAGGYRLAHAALWVSGQTRDLGVLKSLGCGQDMPGTSFATGVNDAGLVVGWSYCEANAPDYYAVLWRNGKLIDLGSGGVYMNSWSGPRINNRGQIVVGREGTAFLWQSGRRRGLGALSGRRFEEVVAISDRGEVVGNSYPREDEYQTFAGAARAFLWRNGKTIDLGTLGEKESNAIGINNAGQAIGVAFTAAADRKVVSSRAFLWQAGKANPLGSLGGKTTSPADINDRGQIVGSSSTDTGNVHAFRWQHGRIVDLGTLSGAKQSAAAAIGNGGQAVGESGDEAGNGHAVLWQHGGTITDLGTLPGGRTSSATAINDKGQILGWSMTKQGKTHAVLWSLPRRR